MHPIAIDYFKWCVGKERPRGVHHAFPKLAKGFNATMLQYDIYSDVQLTAPFNVLLKGVPRRYKK